jgi:hypothetical protein
MAENTWLVTIFRSKAESIKNILINFYDFIKDFEEVKDLHFLIRDRLDENVVVSFRISCEAKDKQIVKSKIEFKLNNLISKDNYLMDPSPKHPLYKYGAWQWEMVFKKRGQKKFDTFCHFLRKMSEVVIEMAKQNYFSSEERTEIAHVMSWMLGCTEYFKLTIKHAEVGYYDRIEDEYHLFLQQRFQNQPK